MDILRGLIGITFLLLICFLLSNNRKRIDWRLVAAGLGIQVVLAAAIFHIDIVRIPIDWIAQSFVTLLGFSSEGAKFLFGGLVADTESFGFIFAFQILPTIVFFSAITSAMYYLGILQVIVYGMAWVMSKAMRMSGAESLAAAANVFVGQTEAPLVIKPYLDKMTKSEMMCLMTGGMATIAGGVFAAFIGYLGGESDAEKLLFAKHLLVASIMSAPAAIVAAKMLYPQTERIEQDLSIPKDKIGANLLDAISKGTGDGLRLAVNVGVMLLVFVAIIAGCNFVLGDMIGSFSGFDSLSERYDFLSWTGNWTTLNDKIAIWSDGSYDKLSLELILGLVFAPVAWLLGVPSQDIMHIGQLLGKKTIINEFIAYGELGELKAAGTIVSKKSILIATYALCGFANFSSIGIQIGGIGALAPGQRGTLAKLGIKALIGGTIAAFFTACIAGMLF